MFCFLLVHFCFRQLKFIQYWTKRQSQYRRYDVVNNANAHKVTSSQQWMYGNFESYARRLFTLQPILQRMHLHSIAYSWQYNKMKMKELRRTLWFIIACSLRAYCNIRHRIIYWTCRLWPAFIATEMFALAEAILLFRCLHSMVRQYGMILVTRCPHGMAEYECTYNTRIVYRIVWCVSRDMVVSTSAGVET